MTPYDTVLYPSYTHPQTHPERLAVLGLLHGLSPAPTDQCRVLELGCGSGNNLIPIAWAEPESAFVGLDLAATPIANGQTMIRELGLANIRLVQADAAQVHKQFGTFDYVIAHGFYSWVPQPVREAALSLVHEVLNPQGVAFISYNALPGGCLRNMLREMMLMHVQGFSAPEEKVNQAKALLKFLAEAQTNPDPYRVWLKAELETVLAHEPGHLYHDELADYNQPYYFTEFVRAAEAQGLQFLSEADYFEMFEHGFEPAVRQALAQLPRLRKEQYLDFLKCRRFRQTLLCHSDLRLAPEARWDQVPRFYISSNCTSNVANPDLASGVTVGYRTAKGARCETDYTLGKAALGILGTRWPIPLPFARLLAEAQASSNGQSSAASSNFEPPTSKLEQDAAIAEQFARFLLSLYAAGMVEFSVSSRGASGVVGEKPATSPVARWQAEHGGYATSLFHVAVKPEDEISRVLLCWLDGTRDRAALLRLLWDFLESRNALDLRGKPEAEVREDLAQKLEENLQKIARMGLLMDQSSERPA